jgi:glycosyltransferase involved in cell wall biosynthesis
VSKISIIIPCYFNEGNIQPLTSKLVDNEKSFPENTDIEYVFIDDGSKDQTYQRLIDFYNKYPEKVIVIKLAGNVGSHNAVLAGMNYASGDCSCILAADLQDPPELIPRMFKHWENGVKLVIANRSDREESFFKKIFASFYHGMIKRFALKNIPANGFDVVLFDKQIQNEIVKMSEKNTSQSYLITWLQFDYVTVPYTRLKREIGKSRWTMSKKIKLFIDAFVSFSFFPIRLITVLGIGLGIISFIYGIAIIIARLSGYIEIEGWAALMAVILLLSSFQMIALGIIGEYVWRTLDASRNRPNFVVDEVVSMKSNEKPLNS